MSDVTGDFEIHVTVSGNNAAELERFAGDRGLKFIHVLLDRGDQWSQPMLTLTGSGSLAQQRALAQRWVGEMRAAGMYPVRTKIEAAPWCDGVPRTDAQAGAGPSGRYFEHHVKLVLPPHDLVATLLTIADAVEPHGARLSRNARREHVDGAQERYVTQRCHDVGLPSATAQLDRLVAALREAGHEPVSVEQEYVVFDDKLELDRGWITEERYEPQGWWVERMSAKAASPAGRDGYPPTYQPVAHTAGVTQRGVFEPAHKQWENAFRAGEPHFNDPDVRRRWLAARRAAMNHVLTIVGNSPAVDQLVLRGSVTMAAWCGDDAREPGDVDFVVAPFSMWSRSPEAQALLDGVLAGLRATAGAGLDPAAATMSEIWTYERADGRRLVIPFAVPGVPPGTIQLDFVFNEHLPVPPEVIVLPGVDVPLRAVTPGLSLAWKLLWLASDFYPQGKDLYDAVLLAELTTVDLALVRDVLRPELGADADVFSAESVLAWNIDWANFVAEYPHVKGGVLHQQRRLARALDRAWS